MIHIRPHSRKDIPLRVKWLNNPIVSKYVGDTTNKRTNIKKETEWFDKYSRNRQKRFFTIYVEDTPIGFIGLSNISKHNRNADLFIAIGEDEYRGKGYGEMGLRWLIHFGFKKLKLHKINLGVIDANVSAIKLYRKIGFQIEGEMRDEVFIKDTWHSMLSMAIFKKDWEEGHKQ